MMTDCSESGHGHEVEYQNQYRIVSAERLAQSCYCALCGEEMRRVYVRETESEPSEVLSDALIVDDMERVLRRGERSGDRVYVPYVASHVESRPIDEPGTVQAKE